MTALLKASKLSLPGRLHETALSLRQGEIACLIGPNGSSKTSLLHALARVGPVTGSVCIGGHDLAGTAAGQRPRLLTFMPASRDVRWPIRARDLIALGGGTPEQVDRRMLQLALDEIAERPVDRLSTGERSRILLARALAPCPKLLLLDEPLANLDPEWQLRLIHLLRGEIAGSDRGALVAVHDLDSAASLGDRLIVMDGGRIAADGLPAEVLGGAVIPQVFGVERAIAGWRLTARADPRSSP